MNNNFSPKKSILSRYSLTQINSKMYQQMLITGGTSCNTQGYVFVPYIMVQSISIEDQRKFLKRLRVKKLNKFNQLK